MQNLRVFSIFCMLLPISVMAQHTESILSVYRSSGATQQFPCDVVDSITFSHTHDPIEDDAIMLWHDTSHDPVLIPIADIDSMKVLSLPSLCPDSHHPHAIDLGLPSGYKWACCNVGASSPENDGGYYAWGEVEEKDSYTWDNYNLAHFDSFVDDYICNNVSLNISGSSYDVARVKWGESWFMPSEGAYHELMNNCTCQQIEYRGKQGWIFTGSNGNSVFFPAAGNYTYTYITLKGTSAQYWTSNFHLDNSLNQQAMFFSISMLDNRPLYNVVINEKFVGRTVRAIAK